MKKVSAGDAGPLQPGEVRQRVPGETGSFTWSTSARVRPFFTYDGYKISLGKEGRK